MSRDPRVFEVVQRQAYEQNEDRIRTLGAALNGVSVLVSEYIWTGSLSPSANERVREEIFKYLINNHLDHLTDEQIKSSLDQIEVELEI